MKIFGLNGEKYSSIFLSFLLSFWGVMTPVNLFCGYFFGRGFVYDTAIVFGAYFAIMLITFLTNKFKVSNIALMVFSFFVIAAMMSIVITPQSEKYIMGADEADMLLRPITSFFLFNFPGFIVATYSLDSEEFCDMLEKFSILTIIVSFFYYFTEYTPEYYMSFSYSILLQVTFITLRCFKKFNVSRLLFAVAGVIMVFVSGCRGALVSYLICVAIYVMTMKINVKKKALIVIITGIIVLVFTLFFEPIIIWIRDVLESLNIDSRTVTKLYEGEFFDDSGRSRIQDKIFQNIGLFGNGLFYDRVLTKKYVHNIILELLCNYGFIFGTIIFVVIIGLLIRALRKSGENEKIIIIALISTGLIKLFFSGSYLNREPAFYIMLGFCIRIVMNKKLASLTKNKDI